MMRSMESTDSSSGSVPPQRTQQPGPVAVPAPYLPPGFRFHPTDEELVVHYLKKKAASMPLPVTIIAEVDLYKFDPWELPEKASFGTEQEWYFFSPRDRKYPNGARPNRAATSGYWKATGTDKPIMASGGSREKVGVKKALVFYRGKPPKGLKTNWIMHEYRLTDAASSTNTSRPPPGSGGGKAVASLRLDDWVLCRIYKKINKHGVGDQLRNMECGGEGSVEDATVSAYQSHAAAVAGMTLGGANYTSLLHHHHEDNFLDGLLTTVEDGGGLSAAGAASLSQLAAVTRASNTAVTKQLLAPPAAATPFNWLDASSSGIAILPPAKRYHGFSRDNADGSTSLSSPAAEGNQLPAGSIDGAGGSGTAAIPTTFLNPLGGMPGATTTYHHHAILGTSSLPPETAFQQPYQLSGVNWNP